MKTTVLLTDSPAPFQKAVREKTEYFERHYNKCEVSPVSYFEDTIYVDKSIVSKRYRVILFAYNLYTVLCFHMDPVLHEYLTEDSVNMGDVMDIIAMDPARVGVKSTT